MVFSLVIALSFLFVTSLHSFFNDRASLIPILITDPGRVEGIYSLCSGTVDKRGVNQSVVAYSLFGPFFTHPAHFARYASRLKETAERIKEVYKG